jgi:hypothetical protein
MFALLCPDPENMLLGLLFMGGLFIGIPALIIFIAYKADQQSKKSPYNLP